MIRCIAVDDEPLIRELLEDNIRQIPYLELVATCSNATEALAVLQTENIDLIFLDIQMPRLNGISFLQSLPHPPMVIFVTAYEQYAIEGYNLQIVDYLLKPFSFERFLKACNRAQELFKMRQPVLPTIFPPSFFVNVEYTLVKINPEEVLYVEALKDYIKIHFRQPAKPVLTRMTLKAMEEKLYPPAFLRIHRSFLVAAAAVTAIKRDMVCIGETEIPYSDFYKQQMELLLK
ncbi:DNA-binding LytR/AlgR family response regulator [Chitinophaga dinghuensis]|uniref:DNA-binding LytR/AlgR family response regulator n=1 Tax=Chitinophaga dinghuensis TaxID=1539050 RepID=A0A327WEJ3_9BACT|nr:response regulator transcription factor [Chitinophaga dinghuensis]RAJ87780.1 DNA-binding LytR/AlgR family response regulator [Chitinophaga dinghuensis]